MVDAHYRLEGKPASSVVTRTFHIVAQRKRHLEQFLGAIYYAYHPDEGKILVWKHIYEANMIKEGLKYSS